jgi:hypothetical protein
MKNAIVMKKTILTVSLALALVCGAAPRSSFATRIVGPKVTGSVTSISGSATIEIDNHVYRIKPGSFAATNIKNIHLGQVVDAELDSSVPLKNAEVVAIAPHVQS